MTIRTRVLVEGDSTAAEVIRAALRSAGLYTVDIEFTARRRDVAPLPVAPRSWDGLADVDPELPYADWRHEMLSLDVTSDLYQLRAPSRRETGACALRRAV